MSLINRISELLKNYELFLIDQPAGSFGDFGKWLSCRHVDIENSKIETNTTDEVSSHTEFYKQMPAERQFLTLISRASRFIDFYIRKALDDTELNSRLEFQFLISIKEMGEPRKTDVIYFNLSEISTGVETLKRLQNRGLIKDYADKDDKRIRRLILTKKGGKVIDEALKKFDVLDNLTKSFGTEQDWKSFIPVLVQFNDLHNGFYQSNRQKSFGDFSNKIIDADYEN